MPSPLVIACVALIFYALIGASLAAELYDSGDSVRDAVLSGARWPLFFWSALRVPPGAGE